MENDHVIRAITNDGAHQLYLVRATNVIKDSFAIRPLSKKATELLGEMMMLALLRANNLKEASQLLTFQLDTTSDAKKVLATANSKGEVKGYISNPNCVGDIFTNMLSCTADMGLKTPYHSSVFVDGNDFDTNVNAFFAQSDQTLLRFHSFLRFDENGDFVEAFAILYHRLPGGEDSAFEYDESKARAALLFGDTLPEKASAFFVDTPFEIVSDEPVFFLCDCSKDKFRKLMETVSNEELAQMATQKEDSVVSCGWCGKSYHFTPAEVGEILKGKKK